MARSWKFWTQGKLDLLRGYAPAFNRASQSVKERIYLDLMAGEPENVNRSTGELFDGSPVIVLSANPGFTRHLLIELDSQRAADLDAYLRLRFPNKEFEVLPGDCNEVLEAGLAKLRPWRWAPTFAFLDQQAADVNWVTLELLARFKRGSPYKTELWILFPAGMAHVRKLPKSGEVRPADVERLNRNFGCSHWQAINDAFLEGQIDGAERREQLVNLMRWRLEKVLGYRWTLPFDVQNERNVSLYHLILATDNEAGLKIMTWLYEDAMRKFPAMAEEERHRQQRAKEDAAGIIRLFDDAPSPPALGKRVKLAYEPPTRPLGLPDDEEC